MTGRAFTPRFIAAARRHRAPVGGRWRVDETYLKIGGRQRYLFRAIDDHGQIIDVYLSDRRNAAAARTFFENTIQESGITPTRVTTDKAKCYPPALRTVLPLAEHRSSKYLNNGLERDHQPGALWAKTESAPCTASRPSVEQIRSTGGIP